MFTYSEVVVKGQVNSVCKVRSDDDLDPKDWPALEVSTTAAFTDVNTSAVSAETPIPRPGSSFYSRRGGWRLPDVGGLKGGGKENNSVLFT